MNISEIEKKLSAGTVIIKNECDSVLECIQKKDLSKNLTSVLIKDLSNEADVNGQIDRIVTKKQKRKGIYIFLTTDELFKKPDGENICKKTEKYFKTMK